MVALNFQKRFADDVECGLKRQTIRNSHRGIIAGTSLQLYYGQRTKSCRKLGDAWCIDNKPITLRLGWKPSIRIFNLPIINDKAGLHAFSMSDGFRDFDDLRDFFTSTYEDDVFDGWLIKW